MSGMVELAFRARGIPIESAASIPITHCTPFNQHRLLRCQYLLASLMAVTLFVTQAPDRPVAQARLAAGLRAG